MGEGVKILGKRRGWLSHSALGAFSNRWFLVFVLAAAADVLVTVWAIHIGLPEVNALFGNLGSWRLSAAKLALTLLIGELCIIRGHMDVLKVGTGVNLAVTYSNILSVVYVLTQQQ